MEDQTQQKRQVDVKHSKKDQIQNKKINQNKSQNDQNIQQAENILNSQINQENENKLNNQQNVFDNEKTFLKREKKMFNSQIINENSMQVILNEYGHEQIQKSKNESNSEINSKSNEKLNKSNKSSKHQQKEANKIDEQTLDQKFDKRAILQELKDKKKINQNQELKNQSQEIIKQILDKHAFKLFNKEQPLLKKAVKHLQENILFDPLQIQQEEFSEKKIIKQKQSDSGQNSIKDQICLFQENTNKQGDLNNFNQSDQNLCVSQNQVLLNINQPSSDYQELDQSILQDKNIDSLSQILGEGKKIKQFMVLNNKKFLEQIKIKLKEKNYEIIRYIASGGEADIFECFYNDEKFALRLVLCNEETEKDIEKEYQIISSIKQKLNLTSYKDMIKIEIPDPDKKKYQKLIIIRQEIYQQSLKNYLISSQNSFQIDIFISFVFDLIHGLIELRSFNIQHFDIKPDNILIDKNYKLYYNDFGLCNKLKNGEKFIPKGFTKNYCSEEQNTYQEIDNYQSDIFSLGKLFDELIKHFFKHNQQLKKESETFFNNFDILIKQMTKKEQQNRIKCINLLLNFTSYLKDVRLEKEVLCEQIDKICTIIDFCKDQIEIIDKDLDFINEIYLNYSICSLKLKLFYYKIEIPYDTDLNIVDNLIQMASQNPNGQFLGDLYIIGSSYFCQAEYYQALKIFTLCFQIGIKHSTEFNFQMNLVNGIGSCYISLGLYEEALELYQATITQIEGINDNKLLKILCQASNNLAECKLINGNHKEAEYLYKLCQKKLQEIGDVNSYFYSQILNNIATFQNDQQDYKEALLNYKHSLEIKRNLLKKEIHPSIAITLNNLGTCYLEIFQISMSGAPESDTLSYLEHVLQNNLNENQQQSAFNLEVLQQKLFDSAFNNIQQAVKIMEQIYYQKSEYYLSQYLNNLATLYSIKGNQKESYDLYLKSLEMKRQMQDPDLQQIAIALQNLADELLQWGRYKEAQEYCFYSIQILKENKMEKLDMYIYALNSYGKILEKLKSEEAIDYYIQAVYCKLENQHQFSHLQLDEFIQDVIDYTDTLDQVQIQSSYEKLDEFVGFLQDIGSQKAFSNRVMQTIKQINDQKKDRKYGYISVKNLEELLKCFK